MPSDSQQNTPSPKKGIAARFPVNVFYVFDARYKSMSEVRDPGHACNMMERAISALAISNWAARQSSGRGRTSDRYEAGTMSSFGLWKIPSATGSAAGDAATLSSTSVSFSESFCIGSPVMTFLTSSAFKVSCSTRACAS